MKFWTKLFATLKKKKKSQEHYLKILAIKKNSIKRNPATHFSLDRITGCNCRTWYVDRGLDIETGLVTVASGCAPATCALLEFRVRMNVFDVVALA